MEFYSLVYETAVYDDPGRIKGYMTVRVNRPTLPEVEREMSTRLYAASITCGAMVINPRIEHVRIDDNALRADTIPARS